MVRAPCCQKDGLKKGRWTDEEDDILTNYIQANGEGSWRSVPKNAGLQRCGKSCRLRWINYLRPDLKRGNITSDEELLIIRLHASMGNRWSLIAGHLPGRTDNEIKNYWNSHLSRKILTRSTPLKAKASSEPKLSSELTADWKPRRGRSKQQASSKNSNRSSGSIPEKNQELVPFKINNTAQPQLMAIEESFEITEYINDEGEDNTTSYNADDSFILSSAQKPSYFTEDLTEVMCSLDDSLHMKVEESQVNLPNHHFKTPHENQKNESKESEGVLSTCSASDAPLSDWDWKGLVNCQKLIEEDEMLSMLWDGCL